MDLPESIIEILKKMCKVINVKFEDVDFTKPQWYLTHTWTEKQEKEFRKWLEDYLYTNSKARKEVMNFPIKNKEAIRRTISWFILDYGWKFEWSVNNEKTEKTRN
jgi:hypothetical protein